MGIVSTMAWETSSSNMLVALARMMLLFRSRAAALLRQ